jgi:ATP-dependent Lon protease
MDNNKNDETKAVVTSLQELLKVSASINNETFTTKRRKVDKVAVNRKRQSEKEIKNPELLYYDTEEKRFYNKLDSSQKKYIASLETHIRNINKEDVPIRFKILLSNIDDKIKAIAIKKLQYLYNMDDSTSEYYKMTNWIESLCKLPIGKYRPLPITKNSSIDDIRTFIKDTKTKLDETVFGHEEAKDQIIRLLAQWISNPTSKGMVIGIHGSPGTGKTLLSKYGISKALDLPFAFLALGGASDSSWLDGHSYTYEGSTWGKIVDILMKAECMNPVMYLDELDKVSGTYKGEEIINTLIHITDSTQNDRFQDKYFVDVDFDISRCLIIFSYNDETAINPILKDRMIKIRTEGYKINDKVNIALKFLIPELCHQFNMSGDDIVFTEDIIKYIINNKCEEEEGVRNLKRALECVLSNINLFVLLSPDAVEIPVKVTEKMINKYIKLPKDTMNEKIKLMYT